MPRSLIIALLACVLAPMSSAQMRGGVRIASRGTGFRHFRSRGFGYPFFYGDYGDYAGEPAVAPSPVVVEKRVFEPERPTKPLLIEWQGDRFVRYGEAQKGEAPDFAEASSGRAASPAASREIPPAVLVYRDGHREEVSDYVIARGILYARGNYSGDGSSLRNIQLSALDLSATMRANQDGSVKFVLPTGPNEVITRP